MKNYYKTFELPSTATQEDIKKRFRELSMKHHPDRVQDKNDLALIKIAEEKFKEINEANSILSDPSKKKKHDKKLQFWDKVFNEYFSKNTW